MARMTQTAIVSSIADATGLKKSEVKTVFDALTDLATTEVKKNGEFTILYENISSGCLPRHITDATRDVRGWKNRCCYRRRRPDRKGYLQSIR